MGDRLKLLPFYRSGDPQTPVDTKLEAIPEFSLRALNAFERLKLVTIADLLKIPLSSMGKTKGCGIVTIREIQDILARRGHVWE